MYQLIKKDFLMQKKTLKLSLLMVAFFAYTFSTFDSVGLVISILAVSYMFVLGASVLEDKNNSDVMLVSLPIKKETIVLAKFISVYAFAVYGLIFNVIIYFLVDLLNVSHYGFPITVDGIFGAFVAVTLLFSVSFPLIFKLGYTKSKAANYLIFFVYVFGGTTANTLLENSRIQFFNDLSDIEIKALVLIPIIIIIILSYRISLHFYKHREF